MWRHAEIKPGGHDAILVGRLFAWLFYECIDLIQGRTGISGIRAMPEGPSSLGAQ